MTGENASPPTYHITATLSPASGVLDNYNVTNLGAEFTINERLATWTTDPQQDVPRPESSPLTTGSGTNFLAADNVTATYSRVAGETVAGGPYHITATLSPAAVAPRQLRHHERWGELYDQRAAGDVDDQPGSKTYGDPDPNPLTTGSGTTSWRPTM